ncbi:hypothetical protein V1478_017419 [Vespula squamosa]|uniref:Uncharacterized protein n=1 Tax=Vespula squamosa TaxID=30214 RepID=A0ABD1ZWU8_VESSQ
MKNESKTCECKYTIVGFQDKQQINVINHSTKTVKMRTPKRSVIKFVVLGVLSLLAKRILTQRTLKT